jgi:hypothetical protein
LIIENKLGCNMMTNNREKNENGHANSPSISCKPLQQHVPHGGKQEIGNVGFPVIFVANADWSGRTLDIFFQKQYSV